MNEENSCILCLIANDGKAIFHHCLCKCMGMCMCVKNKEYSNIKNKTRNNTLAGREN